MGEALKQMAEVKFALEDNVKQNFLEPLTHLQNKDVRDVMVSFGSILWHIFYTESGRDTIFINILMDLFFAASPQKA